MVVQITEKVLLCVCMCVRSLRASRGFVHMYILAFVSFPTDMGKTVVWKTTGGEEVLCEDPRGFVELHAVPEGFSVRLRFCTRTHIHKIYGFFSTQTGLL